VKRIHVLCEGPTEETFVRAVLAPAYSAQLWINPIVVTTKRLESGTKVTGGMSVWSKVESDIRKLLADSSASVTTMFDLFGLPKDCPGFVAASGQSAYNRAMSIQAAISNAVSSEPRFRPYLQVHEFEALVFAGPTIAGMRAGDSKVQQALELAVERAGGPELVNGDPNLAPSKRLSSVWPGYVKTLDGIGIVQEIGLDHLRRECPHFGEWLDWFDEMASRKDWRP
jgi:Domain of unknown function (DUF4276)